MAPNRKNVASLELPIAAEALHNVVQSKFLPLTDPREQEQHEQHHNQQPQQSAVEDSASYWDWPADTQEEEKFDTLFSTAHIVANLIEDGKKYDSSTSNQLAEHDDYWADNSTPVDVDSETADVVRSTKPQHESDNYWSWPANRNLHNEQLAEHLTSTAHLEANLRAFSTSSSTPNTFNKHHDDYWTWNAEPLSRPQSRRLSNSDNYWIWNTLTKEEEREQLIQSILQYEKARQLLTADYIEKQLVAKATETQALAVATTASATPSSGYWDW